VARPAKHKTPHHKQFSPTGKHPVVAQEPSGRKVPRAVEGTSYHQLRPSWRISAMEMVDP
jgi:hypothetical protein